MNAPFAPSGPEAPLPSAQMLPPLAERRDVRKAVILAAGRGSRMGKLTANRPKGALEVGGHALIDWQIEAMRAAGVKEIAVVTGHAPEALAGRDVTYIHNPDWAKGTQVETLLRATDWIAGERAIVSYSDIIYHPCAVLALLERPGDIIVAYDADHRWLWKQRFGNWLKDSETFRLGPGQVLVEIGGKPTDIEELDGQFMGLMLLSAEGLKVLERHFLGVRPQDRVRLDFTSMLGALVTAGGKIDTAANLLPWTEIDSPEDLQLARSMTRASEIGAADPMLIYPNHQGNNDIAGSESAILGGHLGTSINVDYARINDHDVKGLLAIQNWGRSGSTLVQSYFDSHPQILSTPNFYSRRFYFAWASKIGALPDEQKIEAFLVEFRQWWDAGLVDATAGLHRLGEDRATVVCVERSALEGYLRAALAHKGQITRRSLFCAGHLAYALASGQRLSSSGAQIVYPIHGEPRAVAAAVLEDFPEGRFLHTLRDPASNVLSTIKDLKKHKLDERLDALSGTIAILFDRVGGRYGRNHTLYGDRAYFPWLVEADQVRAFKLEDIQREPSAAMNRVAMWVGIEPDERLSRSTWGGHAWRPPQERAAESKGGVASPPIKEREWARLCQKIRLYTDGSSTLREGYGCPDRDIISLASLYASILKPWPTPCTWRRTTLQSLHGLRCLRGILPAKLVQFLEERIAREQYRLQLLELNSGVIAIRRRLSPEKRTATIRASLIVTGRSQKKVRGLVTVGSKNTDESDILGAFFLDDALTESTAGLHLIWASVFVFGGSIAHLHAIVRTTRSQVRALLRRRRESPHSAIKWISA